MFGYRLVALLPNVIPDYQSVPPVALLERNPAVKSVTSLDADLPAPVKQHETLPVPLSTAVAPDLAATKVSRRTASQTAAAVLGLRSTLTAVKVGAIASIPLPLPHADQCQLVATALSPGSSRPQSLTLSIVDPSSHAVLGTTTVEMGNEPTARTVALDLPATGPIVLRLGPGAQDETPVAQWAEPRIECGGTQPG